MTEKEIIRLETQDFDQFIRGTDLPVLVELIDPQIAQCKAVDFIMEKLNKELQGKVKICRINVYMQAELVNRYKVHAIPAVLVFAKWNLIRVIEGLKSQAEYMQAAEEACSVG
jgi:thioredoxin 1